MARKPLPPFPCPKCNELIRGKFVDEEEAREIFSKTSRPVPVVVTCPHQHIVIVYIYFTEGKIAIRERIYALQGDPSDVDWFNV